VVAAATAVSVVVWPATAAQAAQVAKAASAFRVRMEQLLRHRVLPARQAAMVVPVVSAALVAMAVNRPARATWVRVDAAVKAAVAV
jgi:hypothetical protein